MITRTAPPVGGEYDWQYGFFDHNGNFVHHGDEGQARRLARFVKKPIMRRRVWYGPIERMDDEVTPS